MRILLVIIFLYLFFLFTIEREKKLFKKMTKNIYQFKIDICKSNITKQLMIETAPVD
jgi:hypothetical protein